MAEGKTYRIPCTEVISTIGVLSSYNLLGEAHFDKRYHDLKDKIDYGVFCCYMFIGLKGTSKENKLDSYNHWIH